VAPHELGQRGHVGLGHEHDVIAGAEHRGCGEQLAMIAVEQTAMDERHPVDDGDAALAYSDTCCLPVVLVAERPEHAASRGEPALIVEIADPVEVSLHAVALARAFVDDLEVGLTGLDDLRRLEQFLIRRVHGLVALAHDAAPILERVGAADQSAVDDEPAAGFDPTLELCPPRVVDVPAPRRENDHRIGGRVAERFAPLARSAQRLDELLCGVERIRGSIAAQRRGHRDLAPLGIHDEPRRHEREDECEDQREGAGSSHAGPAP
jgi:hypothetical protein